MRYCAGRLHARDSRGAEKQEETLTMASAGGIDREKAKQVALQIMGDVASALHSAMCFIGDRLGLFKAMKDAGPLTVEQLAAKTGLNLRYLQEWLNSMVAAQYLEYDPAETTYLLTPEYAVALAEEEIGRASCR